MLVGGMGCGKSNLFSWAHNPGDSTNTSALASDADIALQNKDYAKALEYYQEILKNDPRNSEAIYGYAAAKLAESGLDIGSLVANLIKNQSTSNSSVALCLAQAARSSSFSGNILPDTLLIKSNRDKLLAAINASLANDKLKKIIKGEGDGSINPTNADLNLNVAFCLVLRAAITVYDSGSITIGTDYKITVNSVDLVTATSASQDIASAFKRLEVVVKALNLASDATIAKIKTDVNALYDDFKSKIPGLNVDIDHDYYLD